jgi:hypothetical protein
VVRQLRSQRPSAARTQGRTIAGGGAGRAAAAGGPGLLCSWADEPTLRDHRDADKKCCKAKAGRTHDRPPANSLVLVARKSQRTTAVIDLRLSLRLCDAGKHTRRLCTSLNFLSQPPAADVWMARPRVASSCPALPNPPASLWFTTNRWRVAATSAWLYYSLLASAFVFRFIA